MISLLLTLALSAAGPDADVQGAKPAKPKKICEKVEMTGSSVPKRVCRTVVEPTPPKDKDEARTETEKPATVATN